MRRASSISPKWPRVASEVCSREISLWREQDPLLEQSRRRLIVARNQMRETEKVNVDGGANRIEAPGPLQRRNR